MSGGKRRSVEATALALLDREAGSRFNRSVRLSDFDRLDARSRRRVRRQPPRECLDRLGRAGDHDLDLAGPIDHRAVEPELRGQPPHERPEADALDHATDLDRPHDPLDVGRRLTGRPPAARRRSARSRNRGGSRHRSWGRAERTQRTRTRRRSSGSNDRMERGGSRGSTPRSDRTDARTASNSAGSWWAATISDLPPRASRSASPRRAPDLPRAFDRTWGPPCATSRCAAQLRPRLSHTRTLQFPPAERPASQAKRSRLRPPHPGGVRPAEAKPRLANPAARRPPERAGSAGSGPRPGATP